jgi:hypothetical protein
MESQGDSQSNSVAQLHCDAAVARRQILDIAFIECGLCSVELFAIPKLLGM